MPVKYLFCFNASVIILLVGLFLAPQGFVKVAVAEDDPYIWLESSSSPQAQDWVKSHNEKSLNHLTQDPRFETVRKQIREILLAPDRVPAPNSVLGSMVYNFWQDSKHVRGIWRRTPLESYRSETPNWETILDVDALAKAENENWVFEGGGCLPPKLTHCMISLSRGGGDANVRREFDLTKKAFIQDGFYVPEAKSDVTWQDENTLLVGTNWGEGSLTSSGYSRIVKRWSRGTPLKDAKTVYEGQVDDVSVAAWSSIRPEGSYFFVGRSLNFFNHELRLINGDSLIKVAIPEDSIVQGVFQNELFFSLRTDWSVDGRAFVAGSLLAIAMSDLEHPKPEIVLVPDSRTSLQAISKTRDGLFVHVLENVSGSIYRAQKTKKGWVLSKLPIQDSGTVSIEAANEFEHDFVTSFEGFLTPASYYLHSDLDPLKRPEVLKQEKSRFNGENMIVEQFHSSSLDGTEIPYYVIRKKDLPLNGSLPTILYAYGGFEVSETPWYLGYAGKTWVEAGGVFVLANIRGGGEFGPNWHNSVIKENRHKVFEDFASVAEDLFEKKITSPRRLGIRGGSNGGLLVGASFVLRPELFNAVSCEVPLLDMIRYPLLGAGTSWEGEYGDPADPAMASAILKYSPYQNVKPGIKYPKVFFSTATTDDRVTPFHARKMVAKMEAQGHDVLFYENTDGGHGAAANLEEMVRDRTLILIYFFQQLFD